MYLLAPAMFLPNFGLVRLQILPPPAILENRLKNVRLKILRAVTPELMTGSNFNHRYIL
jgi:hypothetical protein